MQLGVYLTVDEMALQHSKVSLSVFTIEIMTKILIGTQQTLCSRELFLLLVELKLPFIKTPKNSRVTKKETSKIIKISVKCRNG